MGNFHFFLAKHSRFIKAACTFWMSAVWMRLNRDSPRRLHAGYPSTSVSLDNIFHTLTNDNKVVILPRVNLQELHIKEVTRCENPKLTWCQKHRADRASSPDKKSPRQPRVLTGKPSGLPCDAEGLV